MALQMENTKASIFSGVSHQFGHGFPGLDTACSTSFLPFLTCDFFRFFSFYYGKFNSTKAHLILYRAELDMCREAEENTTENEKNISPVPFPRSQPKSSSFVLGKMKWILWYHAVQSFGKRNKTKKLGTKRKKYMIIRRIRYRYV